ncbi:hypothetical protein [Jeotgalicoccus sp. WY2]|uniref:hypothetical protein n=1 Tax=Jeotgalicoccus sp. WY2 TaxID=2708346 RepID=UPI001BD3641D|nr:hypothetical protein [Jeotgalicoccus sp. WY2]
MKGFLYIFQKNKIMHDCDEVTKYIDKLKQTKHDFSFKESHKIKSYFYTNEKKTLNNNESSKFISLIGQFVERTEDIITSLSKLEDLDLRDYVSDLKGAFALALADFSKSEMNSLLIFSGLIYFL